MTRGHAGRRRIAAALVAAAVATGLVAGSHTAAQAQAQTRARTQAPQSVAARRAAGTNAVRIVAHDGAHRMWFDTAGAPHAGRVAITLVNRGRYAHEATLARLKKGVTLARFKRTLMDDGEPAAAKLIVDPDGEITGPALIGPGLRETAYAPLHAGHYAVLCFLPGPDGMPHAMMGMIGGFRVRPRAVTTAAPHTDGTIRLTRNRILLPHGFTHGGTFKVVNTSKLAHDLSFARLRGATSLEELFGCVGQAFGTGTPIDTCPGTLAGGISDLAPGRTAYLRVRFTRGRYGYLSTDGDDFAHGMRGTFTVR